MRNCSHGIAPTIRGPLGSDSLSSPRCPRHSANTRAFTRFELAVVLGALVLLGVLVLPALANTKLRSQRLACFNNLGRIGQALEMWGTERGGAYPWQVLSSEGSGGTRSHPSGLGANIWFQFAVMSNELVTPKYLACPSDAARVVATDFSLFPNGGFLHANYRNRAVSYLLGHPFLQEGRGILSGDRNIEGGSFNVSCSYFGPPVMGFQTPSSASWSTNIHTGTGNLLFNDGSVLEADNASLRASINNTNFDNYSVHFLGSQ